MPEFKNPNTGVDGYETRNRAVAPLEDKDEDTDCLHATLAILLMDVCPVPERFIFSTKGNKNIAPHWPAGANENKGAKWENGIFVYLAGWFGTAFKDTMY